MEEKEDLQVHELHYDKDGLNLKVGGQTAMFFLQHLVELFQVNGGKNFLTMTVHKDDIKYAITIQNCNGVDTPSEKLERQEKEIELLRKRIEEVCSHKNIENGLYMSNPPKYRCEDCGKYLTQDEFNSL
jgi:hypothetical protein